MLFGEIDYSDKKIQFSALPHKNNYPFYSKQIKELNLNS